MPRAVATLASVLCHAVVPVTTRAQGVGLVGGVSLGEINAKGNEPANVVLTDKPEAVGGVYVAFDLGDRVSFEPEVLLAARGSRLEVVGIDQQIRLTYLDIPLLFRLSPSPTSSLRRLRLALGPYVGYLLSASSRSFRGGGVTTVDDAFRRVDWGWLVGVGVNAGPVDFDARYGVGVADIARRDGVLPLPGGQAVALRNRGISLLGRFRF